MAVAQGIFPGAKVRLIPRWNSGRPRTGGAASIDAVILHIAVTSRSTTSLHGFFSGDRGVCSHFFVANDGSVEQYMDAVLARDAASVDAANRSISIETAGGAGSDLAVGWSAAQVETIAQICAWANRRFGVPLRAMTSSKRSDSGVGWHALGVPANAAQKAARTSQTGGQMWSTSVGKVCPGVARIRQVPAIVARAKAIAAGAAPSQPQEDDMPLSADDIARVAEATRAKIFEQRMTGPGIDAAQKPTFHDYLIQRLPRLTAAAVHEQWLGSSGPSIGTAVQTTYNLVRELAARDGVDIDEAQVAALTAAALRPIVEAAVEAARADAGVTAEAVVDELVARLTPGAVA